ncbi:hypothetical protein BSY19_4747 (plasmid) [Bosea sp. RAC05]|nr:hypothetical protein BSY19_4747 [Bosea sp. RAC05]
MALSTRTLDDFGEKIGGARKDMWRDRLMTLDDLGSLSLEEAVAFVAKDLIWPVPDYAALAADGIDPMALALRKIVRDRMPVTPCVVEKASQPSDPKQIYAYFIKATSLVRDTLEQCRTVDDVKGATSAILTALGWYEKAGWKDPEIRATLFTIMPRRHYPFELSQTDHTKANRMVADGFPSSKVEPWLKGVRIAADGRGAFMAVKSGVILVSGKPDHDSVVAHLKEVHSTAAEAKKDKPKSPPMYRERIDKIDRSGLEDYRNGVPITPEAFTEQFGFRGVEFGEWLPDGERQLVLDHAYDALRDMAVALDIPDRLLSLGGRLALAFGSRGNGRPAHYEPTRIVINLSKMTGAGALAHEVGHALDHLLGEAGFEGVTKGDVHSLSGWYSWSKSRASSLGGLGADAAQAWDEVMTTLRSRRRTRDEQVAHFDTRLELMNAQLDEQEKHLADFKARGGGRLDSKFEGKMLAWLSEQKFRIARLTKIRTEFIARPEVPGDVGESSYMAEANALCGSSGEYWKRPTEMFARAFECVVFDAIAAKGGRSDYLVQGVEMDRYAGPRWKGNPYPTGDERVAINEAFRKAIALTMPVLERLAEAEPTTPSPH